MNYANKVLTFRLSEIELNQVNLFVKDQGGTVTRSALLRQVVVRGIQAKPKQQELFKPESDDQDEDELYDLIEGLAPVAIMKSNELFQYFKSTHREGKKARNFALYEMEDIGEYTSRTGVVYVLERVSARKFKVFIPE